MAKVISVSEFAKRTGRSLEEAEALIAEADSDAITRESLDASTLTPPKLTPEAEGRFRAFLRKAGARA